MQKSYEKIIRMHKNDAIQFYHDLHNLQSLSIS